MSTQNIDNLVNFVFECFTLDIMREAEEEIPEFSREHKESKQYNDNFFEISRLPKPSPHSVNDDDSWKASWMDHFKNLKIRRLRIDREFDEASKEYADSYAKKDLSSSDELDDQEGGNVFSLAVKRKEILEDTVWICSAAIYTLRKCLNKNKNKGNNFSDFDRKLIASLIALYHSELCAAATPDVSLAMAQRFEELVPRHGDTDGTRVVLRDWFQAIAGNNIARGYIHMGDMDSLEAARRLDKEVDRWLAGRDKKTNASGANNEAPLTSMEEDVYTDPKALFLIWIPAVRILAEALGDMGRHSERIYYLQKAREKVSGTQDNGEKKHLSEYWNHILLLDLALAYLDRDGKLSETKFDNISDKSAKPKQLQLWHQIHAEISKEKGQISPEKSWKSRLWLIRWHGGQLDPLLRATESAAKSLDTVTDKDTRIQFLHELQEVLDKIHKRWHNHAVDPLPGKVLSFLLSPSVANRIRLVPRWKGKVWKTAMALYASIPNKSKHCNRELQEWENILKENIIQEDKEFSDFRSDVSVVNLTGVPNTQSSSRNGARSRRYCSIVKREGKECDLEVFVKKGRCMRQVLDIPDNGDLSDATGKLSRTGFDYRLSMMAIQQERFLNYLDPSNQTRECKNRSYVPGEATRPSPDFEVISLRRWNSFSPNLGSRASSSVGGGYLVRIWADHCKCKRFVGIAVDPGYNFLENLFNEAFTVTDVDVMVLTHAHPDHTENLTNFLTLLREKQKRQEQKQQSSGSDKEKAKRSAHQRVVLVMTEGVFERYWSLLRAEREFIRDIVVLKAKEWRGSDSGKCPLWITLQDGDDEIGLKLWETTEVCAKPNDVESNKTAGEQPHVIALVEAKRAWHFDGTDHDAMGVAISRIGGSGETKTPRVGIIGDSRYHPELHGDYEDCDVLVAHVGSLLDAGHYNEFHVKEDSDRFVAALNERIAGLLREKNHLYLPGIARLLCDLVQCSQCASKSDNFPLVILSEFGEELRGGLRCDLTQQLANVLSPVQGKSLPLLPADVGLRVDIVNKRVFCSICHRYVSPSHIEPVAVDPDEEALAYVCGDCSRFRHGELSRLLEEWCSTARPLPSPAPER